MDRPIFFDASGKRSRWSKRVVATLLVLIVSATLGFAWTVASVPADRAIYPVGERIQARPLTEQVAHLRHRIGSWLPPTRTGVAKPVSAGFYVPWDPDSRVSLARNIDALDWVVPSVASYTDGGQTRAYTPDAAFHRIIDRTARKPRVLPMIQNAAGDKWDGAGIEAVMRDPARRKALLDWSERVVTLEKGSGAVFDFEELPHGALAPYRQFLREAKARFAPKGWLVTLAVPLDDDDWDLRTFAEVSDRLFLMDYDEHSSTGDAGPIASQDWFVANLKRALAQVPQDKAIVAVGSYAYDWAHGGASDLTAEEAWLAAHDSGATVRFDPASGNSGFSYENAGQVHTVWMLDAASAWNQLRAAKAQGVAGYALWRLGSEDPGYWAAIRALPTGGKPDLSRITPIGNVDVEGSGELLRIEDTPVEGTRTVAFDAAGLIRDQQFARLPTPYAVRRGGDRPGMVALTFDDGPDPTWTPQILNVLEAKKAPATFFVIGENALSQPGLLNRIVAGGSEIGNHSYTHPNMAEVSDRGIELELNATQRLVEAYTGKSMRLFRAPYFGDAEPTTSDELRPAWVAQQRGYLNVGLHADPNDWQRPGVLAIVEQSLKQVENSTPDGSARIVLLHDGGGDRSQTVAALPQIIDGLRAKGYTLVPISTLAGLPPAAVMPPVTGWQLTQVRADIGVFLVVAGLLWTIKWLFFVAIALGIARAVLMAALAVRAWYRGDRADAPPIDPARFVSVLIPAFNEERVIVDSVRRVLASEQVALEILVIDDGSSDATSAVVREAFAGEPRVRLLTLENGGKAKALNRGLTLITGDIVIALDADTRFEPLTVAHLARWFADPAIGAVAGNAKVGNRFNLVTRWQSVEYVTAQNLERRALTQFDAITVVPGAVGAWRRAALDAVGGYPVDTLAEDQDLTIAIQRQGWRIGYDVEAVAWTEAPESFRALAKQRFRWSYGTLQCLWKHRSILKSRKPMGLALVGIPQAWLFQIVFAVISPIIDFALLVSIVGTVLRVEQHGWAQTQSDVLIMALYWIMFTGIDIACGAVAYWLDPRERRYPAHLLVAQRFIYRQLMYGVVLKAVGAALRGPSVGWGKLERSGRVANTAQ
ncbi:polysaccharide deacetylase family protein [Sphingomonas sp. SUN039]|uniref:polysaccharide deacetylase family protein n=1 Tax=Sphingomonas sp. SUN039 TaxID=2937787 RepID=UPI0021643BE3|nr:glycosyltransferase [Sphingomonas sp. SUN039]UVO55354.1 glycosyltransferase [Sphingomonas sp. SUN039]